MKHLLIPILLTLLISACGPSKEEIEAREKQRADSSAHAQQQMLLQLENGNITPTEIQQPTHYASQYANNANFQILIYLVNGCEYISFNGHGGGIVHAGNCCNPIHHKPTDHTSTLDLPLN